MPPETAITEDLPDARQRLLVAAEEIFADHGYEGASIRQICTKAEVNIAGVNYHFGDKERLYIETVKHAHACGGGGSWPEVPAGTPPAVELEAFIRGMVSAMHAPVRTSAAKLVMRELSDPGKAAHTVVDEFIRPMAFRLRDILRRLMPHLEESRLLMYGFSIIAQCLYYRQNRLVSELIFGKEHLERLTVDMVADHVVRFTLAAISADLTA